MKTDLQIRLELAAQVERLSEALRAAGVPWHVVHAIANGPAPDEG